jgi:hypothetical protein
MKRSYRNIALDSRTVLLGSSIQDILKRTEKKRKGIDFMLHTVAGANDKDKQTVMTALSSMQNPNPNERREKGDIDKLLSESLDRILIADRVRSCNDFYKVNNKKNMDSSNSMQVSF